MGVAVLSRQIPQVAHRFQKCNGRGAYRVNHVVQRVDRNVEQCQRAGLWIKHKFGSKLYDAVWQFKIDFKPIVYILLPAQERADKTVRNGIKISGHVTS
ncbi:hypothetical protein ASF04_20940 [Duganella sp. Leaf61]|nr:hypothetical protein ASF04_20940 [Duganella sp. Leaf61]